MSIFVLLWYISRHSIHGSERLVLCWLVPVGGIMNTAGPLEHYYLQMGEIVRCNNKRSREGRSWLSQVSRTFSPRLSSGEAENYLNQIFLPFLPHINCWFFASASSCGDKKISAARNNKIKLHPELFFSPTGATRVGWHFWWQKRRILFSWFMRNILNRLYKVWNFICKFPTSR